MVTHPEFFDSCRVTAMDRPPSKKQVWVWSVFSVEELKVAIIYNYEILIAERRHIRNAQ